MWPHNFRTATRKVKAAAPLAKRAYLEVRNRILTGDLPVGVALPQRKLAAGLKVSVPPVIRHGLNEVVEGFARMAIMGGGQKND